MTPGSLGGRIEAWPRLLFAVVAGSLAILVSGWFYPPRLEVWSRRDTRLQEWSRADGFLKQCERPFRQDVEPAVRWRLLPPLVCQASGETSRWHSAGWASAPLPWPWRRGSTASPAAGRGP